MHVAITGASGFIGTALQRRLREAGHTISRLVRRAPQVDDEIGWDIDAGRLDPADLTGVDAVVHLAGEGIGERRWTAAQKRRILESRTKGTGLVAEAVANADHGPRVLVSASAIGYYGDRGDEVLTEDSQPGAGFLAEVVQAWEAAAEPARAAGVRVVHPRFGLVQSPGGGMLPRILPLFRAGLGGRLGSGEHYWSWIGLPDVVGAVQHALTTDDLSGPINVTAPTPMTNAEYTKVLAGVLRRPAVLSVPRFGPALLLGRELSQELLFFSQRVVPSRLSGSYTFRYTDLESCLRDLLDRPQR